LLFNGEGSNSYRNGTIFSGTLREGIPDLEKPFKFVYPYAQGSYERKQGEEPTCTLITGEAELKNGWFQTGQSDKYDDYYFVNEKSGALYDGKKEPDQNG